MKCDHLIGRTFNGEVYVLASEAMEAIAELKQKLEDAKANKATCKELKAYSVVASSEVHNYINGEINLAFEAYDADEVDAAIAEIKAELDKTIAERDGNQVCIDALKQKLENVQASMYCDVVDANMENRRLKRALWITRAERAIAEAEYWYGHTSGMYYIDAKDVPDEEDDPYKRVKDTTIGWYKTWMNVERKCREKAEEYK